MRTIPGTYIDYQRCSYDELCQEARDAIDAVVNSHAFGAQMNEQTALMLLRFLGMNDGEADDLLTDARLEAMKPLTRQSGLNMDQDSAPEKTGLTQANVQSTLTGGK